MNQPGTTLGPRAPRLKHGMATNSAGNGEKWERPLTPVDTMQNGNGHREPEWKFGSKEVEIPVEHQPATQEYFGNPSKWFWALRLRFLNGWDKIINPCAVLELAELPETLKISNSATGFSAGTR
jgi:hypothetical protein